MRDILVKVILTILTLLFGSFISLIAKELQFPAIIVAMLNCIPLGLIIYLWIKKYEQKAQKFI